jgi:hypothetical protein
MELQRPENNYLMLETYSKEKNEMKYLYIIHMKDKTCIRLGRANDADVRMTDISISRNHAYLKMFNGNFFLEDCASKFGTLTLLRDKISAFHHKNLGIQIRKHFLQFQVKRNFLAIMKCFKPKTSHIIDYNDYFDLHLKENHEKKGLIEGVDLNSQTEKVSLYHSEIEEDEQGEQNISEQIDSSKVVQMISNEDNFNTDNNIEHFIHESQEEAFIVQTNSKKQEEKCESIRSQVINNKNVLNNPAIQLNINIQVGPSSNGSRVEMKNKNDIKLKLSTSDVKNLVDNIFNNINSFQGAGGISGGSDNQSHPSQDRKRKSNLVPLSHKNLKTFKTNTKKSEEMINNDKENIEQAIPDIRKPKTLFNSPEQIKFHSNTPKNIELK